MIKIFRNYLFVFFGNHYSFYTRLRLFAGTGGADLLGNEGRIEGEFGKRGFGHPGCAQETGLGREQSEDIGSHPRRL